jgi:hypothetical protein
MLQVIESVNNTFALNVGNDKDAEQNRTEQLVLNEIHFSDLSLLELESEQSKAINRKDKERFEMITKYVESKRKNDSIQKENKITLSYLPNKGTF